MSTNRPSGSVTFLFSDIEDSTRLWDYYPKDMACALARHDMLLRRIFEAQNGYVFKTVGDEFCVAFDSPSDALDAALDIQHVLLQQSWGKSPIKVRIGLHTGETVERDSDYFGPAVNRAARLMSAGHGGQVLLSGATWALVRNQLPEGITLRDLGRHNLKGLSQPEQIYQVVASNLPHEFPTLRTLDNRVHNLPAHIAPFIGRETELEAIHQLLGSSRDSAGDVRLLTLIGPGGTGKTRLVVQSAQGFLPYFKDGVFFVPLESVESPAGIVPALCQALGFQPADESQAGRSIEEQLLDYLRHKRLLLIIDNFEQLIAGAGLLSRILRSTSSIYLLVTSRQKLGLRGERLYILEGLHYPQVVEPVTEAEQLLTSFSAAALFASSARLVEPCFELDDGDVASLIQLCRLVDGMPLALELAAGWVNVLSLPDIVAEIEQGLSILESDLVDLPDRHRNMEAVFDFSWRQLAPAEQAIFAQLCVFRGGFTRGAAGHVTGAALRQLAILANKSLIQFDRKSNRYQIHRLLRRYGADKLTEDPAAEKAVRESHCTYFCDALHEGDSLLKGAGQLEALADLDKESANAGIAWYYAAETGKVAKLDVAADGLNRFYLWRRHFQAGEVACKAAEEALLRLLPSVQTVEEAANLRRILARIRTWHSIFCEQAQADKLITLALELLESAQLAPVDTRREWAFAWQRAGDLAFEKGNENTKQLYERSLALYRKLGDNWGTAKLLTALGWLAAHGGEKEEAQQLAHKALTIAQKSGDRKQTADILWLLATLAVRQGHFEESGHLFAECLDLRNRLGDRLTDIVTGPIDLGMPLTWIGRFADADAIREEALALYEAQDQPEHIAQAHVFLANSKMHTGEFGLSKHHALTGLRLCREVGNQRGAGMALWTLALLALPVGEVDQAASYLQESEAIFRQMEGASELLGWVFGGYTEVARRRGQPALAKEYIYKALHLASGLLGLISTLVSLMTFLHILADEGQKERAVELSALLGKYPLMSKTAFARVLWADRVEKMKASLPPEVAEAAQARGLARDLQETAAEILLELEPFIVD